MSAAIYQLVGCVDEHLFRFAVEKGCYSVGALEEVDLVVPVRGVSRKHATLTVDGEGITVEDLGSKNGTFVNGRKVSKSTVFPGDVLNFGPASMTLVQVDPDDIEIGIKMNDEGEQIVLFSVSDIDEDTQTEHKRSPGQAPEMVRLIGRYASLIGSGEAAAIGEALAMVARELECIGACLFSWDGENSSVVRGSFGVMFPFFDHPDVGLFLRDAREIGKRESVLISHGRHEAPMLGWAIIAEPGEDLWGIVVNRDAAPPPWMSVVLESLLQVTVAACRECPSIVRPRIEPFEETLTIPENHVAGRSETATQLYDQLRQLLQGDIPVLITGETGVGKEHIARILHASSDRSGGPFIAVNCAAIPEELLESELFGIRSGVATGVTERRGKFEAAKGGTLVLDEIGEMPMSLQAKLLRVVQEMEVHPLGASQPVPIDVRLVSITNAPLQQRVNEGKFRRDLFYRVAAFNLVVPPLRERRTDIPLLVEHFLHCYTNETKKSIQGISVKALHLLAQARWPGNIRELSHEIRRLVYLCGEGQVIDSSMLSPSVLKAEIDDILDIPDHDSDLRLEHRTADLERKLITLALARTKNNRSKAAKLLGISRNGLALKVDRLGIKF